MCVVSVWFLLVIQLLVIHVWVSLRLHYLLNFSRTKYPTHSWHLPKASHTKFKSWYDLRRVQHVKLFHWHLQLLILPDLRRWTHHLFSTNLLIFLNSLVVYMFFCFFGGKVLFLTASNSLPLLDLKTYCDLSPGFLHAGPILPPSPHQKFRHWLLLMIFHTIFWITPFFHPHCHHPVAMDTQTRNFKC